MKKILAMLLCAVMVLSLASVTMAAEEGTITYDFAKLELGKEEITENALDVFKAATTDNQLVSVTTSKIYPGNADGGAHKGENGYLKSGTSKVAGQIVLTYAEGVKVTKVDVVCHDWYAKSEKYPTNSNTVSVNGSEAVLAPYNETGACDTLSFNVSETNVVTIDLVNRVWISKIIVHVSGNGGSTEPKPTEPKPTEPKPTEPKPTEPAAPAVKLENVTAPAEGTAYKFGLFQTKSDKQLYVDGTVSGRYLGMTEDHTAAVDVYVEAAEGGYKFYILVEGAKNYITVYNNDEGKLSVKYDAAGTSVFAYNAECNNWVTKLDEQEYYLGTYNTYNTISASKVSYINAENTGVDQFPANLYTVTVEENDKTGDMIGVVIALLAVSGMGIAVLKKEN